MWLGEWNRNLHFFTGSMTEWICTSLLKKIMQVLPDVKPWDKDAIVAAIEADGERLNKLAGKAANGNITPENVVPALNHIYEMLNDNIEDKQTKGFVTSRLKQVINKLAA